MFLIKQINQNIVLGILDLTLFSKKYPLAKQRELEKRGAEALLNELLKGEVYILEYTTQGKPYLKNSNKHISISHSHQKLAICVNELENVGIDIELIRDKVKGIEHKFLNVNERNKASQNTEKLILYWAAKETLYKLYGLKGLDFIENLEVEDFEGNKIFGKITINDYNKRYLLHWEKLDDYILVYSLNEI